MKNTFDQPKELRAWRWAKKGAVFGIIVAITDLTGWRGINYIPMNNGLDILLNLAHGFGSMFGGALFFGLAGAIVSLFAKNEN